MDVCMLYTPCRLLLLTQIQRNIIHAKWWIGWNGMTRAHDDAFKRATEIKFHLSFRLQFLSTHTHIMHECVSKRALVSLFGISSLSLLHRIKQINIEYIDDNVGVQIKQKRIIRWSEMKIMNGSGLINGFFLSVGTYKTPEHRVHTNDPIVMFT